MKQQKTWLHIHFTHNKASVEATLNYETKSYSLTHGNNDNNIVFTDSIDNINRCFDRVKCVQAALKFIQKELN